MGALGGAPAPLEASAILPWATAVLGVSVSEQVMTDNVCTQRPKGNTGSTAGCRRPMHTWEPLAASMIPLDIIRWLFLQFPMLRNLNFVPEAIKGPPKISE